MNEWKSAAVIIAATRYVTENEGRDDLTNLDRVIVSLIRSFVSTEAYKEALNFVANLTDHVTHGASPEAQILKNYLGIGTIN